MPEPAHHFPPLFWILLAILVFLLWFHISGILAVFFHEIAHSTTASILGKKDIRIVIGSAPAHPSDDRPRSSLIRFGKPPWNRGFTSYTPPPSTFREALLIAGSGPALSGIVTLCLLATILMAPLSLILLILLVPPFLSNLRVFLASILPPPSQHIPKPTSYGEHPAPVSDLGFILGFRAAIRASTSNNPIPPESRPHP